MKESNPAYLCNVCIEGQILIYKNNFRISYSVTGGQGNVIQSKYLVRCHLSDSLGSSTIMSFLSEFSRRKSQDAFISLRHACS